MALGDLVSAVDVGALTGDLAANVAASFRQALATAYGAGPTTTWPSPDHGGSIWPASTCQWSSGKAGRIGWSITVDKFGAIIGELVASAPTVGP